MDIKMTFKHMDHNDELKDYISQKSEKLKKYFDGKIHLNWNFTLEKHERIAHCHLTGNHMDFFGEARAEDMRDAINETVEAIEKQVRKKKETLKNHHKAG